ncbi:MAG: ketoacyl-ACP synthase III [Planctomycetes bacterium]|nr:ketoacyl-ACP synthase III [Planctomycetota bacterium]
MTSRVRVGTAGTGSYVPERVVPNSWFESQVDTSDEWIVQRTGIQARRYVAPGEATSDMALRAAERALAAAGLQASDLDLIVCGTLTPDHILPGTAALLQHRLGATRSGAFDCNAACTGFMTAFNTAEAFIAAGRARHVLAIGAETLSRYVDQKDRGSCILFGDGAGAAVLSPWEDCRQGEVLRTILGADGSGYEHIHMVAGGSRLPPTVETVQAGQHYIRVNGREVFRFAVQRMSELIEELARGHEYDEIGLVVPHQVNRRIIDAALERLGWTDEKVMVNIQHYGNTSAASVPVALDEAVRAGRAPKDKLVIMVAFGAGLTWGGALLRW